MKNLWLILLLFFVSCKSRQSTKQSEAPTAPVSTNADSEAKSDKCAVFVKGQAMVNAENGECQVANNKCESDKLAASGHLLSEKECVSKNCAMFFMAQTMFNPQTNACAKAGNGCSVANLEGVGYRLAQQGECVKE